MAAVVVSVRPQLAGRFGAEERAPDGDAQRGLERLQPGEVITVDVAEEASQGWPYVGVGPEKVHYGYAPVSLCTLCLSPSFFPDKFNEVSVPGSARTSDVRKLSDQAVKGRHDASATGNRVRGL